MISVIMPTHNSIKYVEQQISSILSQLSDEDELIIVDDCSEDNTLNFLFDNYTNNPLVHIYSNNTNIGINKSFEFLLSKTKGDYIFFSDADDVWVDGKIVIMTKYLEDFDLVMHNGVLCDKDLNETSNTFFAIRKCGSGLFKNLVRNTYCGCMVGYISKK